MEERDKRNIIGCIMWFAVAMVINLIALIPMLMREYYQYRRYNLKAFEWDDVIRYTVAMLLGTALNYFIIINMF